MGTVLLIDDDVDLVEAYKLIVTQHGHGVKAAYSAEDRRELLKSERPGAIVPDVMMERLDSGFDPAREVNQQFPDLPIIPLAGIHQVVCRPFHFEPDETWLPVGQAP